MSKTVHATLLVTWPRARTPPAAAGSGVGAAEPPADVAVIGKL